MRWLRKTEWAKADGTVTGVEATYGGRNGPVYAVSFNYKVGEHWHGGFFRGTDEYKQDDWLPVSYDPADPDRNAYAMRENRRRIGAFVVVLASILLGLAWAVGASR